MSLNTIYMVQEKLLTQCATPSLGPGVFPPNPTRKSSVLVCTVHSKELHGLYKSFPVSISGMCMGRSASWVVSSSSHTCSQDGEGRRVWGGRPHYAAPAWSVQLEERKGRVLNSNL